MEYPEQDQEDLIEESTEANNEAQEDYYEDTSPSQERTEDLYTLIWKTINIKDNSKVGNLDKQELGMLDVSVRDALRISDVAKTLGHKGFARWMNEQAQIILKTSSSKKGWLVELFVTAKRFASKIKQTAIPVMQTGRKKSFWGRNKR